LDSRSLRQKGLLSQFYRGPGIYYFLYSIIDEDVQIVHGGHKPQILAKVCSDLAEKRQFDHIEMVAQLLLVCSDPFSIGEGDKVEIFLKVDGRDFLVTALHIFYCNLSCLLLCSTIFLKSLHFRADILQVAAELKCWILWSGRRTLHSTQLLQTFADIVEECLFEGGRCAQPT
jgi:hypothetical protein